MNIPFIRPNPPKMSMLASALAEIEASGIYTNYGPVNEKFENAARKYFFSDRGSCLTVCNATIGLILAIQEVIEAYNTRHRRYALMPSFTFAATAQAAIWCGLTPIFCDIDPETWQPDADDERRIIEQYADDIAVIVPYATFGNNLDLSRYAAITKETGIPIVVDAAASLGSSDERNHGFGTDFHMPVVFSMHVTKTYSTAEGGLIYCADREMTTRMRHRGNFGFSTPRTATMLGLNSKLPEVLALLALQKLESFDAIVERRSELAALYKNLLKDIVSFQETIGTRIAYQFMPVLLPEKFAQKRENIMESMSKSGVGVASYFSPHLAEQPLFREKAKSRHLPITDEISRRVLSLPLYDTMTNAEIMRVCQTLQSALQEC